MQHPFSSADCRIILGLPQSARQRTFEFLAGPLKKWLPEDELVNLDAVGEHIMARNLLTMVCPSWASFFTHYVPISLTSLRTALSVSQGSLEDLRMTLSSRLFSLMQQPPAAEETATSPLGPAGIIPGLMINGVAWGSQPFPTVPSRDHLHIFSKWLFRMPWVFSIKGMTIHDSPGDGAESYSSHRARRRAMAQEWAPSAASYAGVLKIAKQLSQAYLNVPACSQVERAITDFRLDGLSLDSDGIARYCLLDEHFLTTTPESIRVVFKGSPIMNFQAFAGGVRQQCGDAAAVEYFRSASLFTWHTVRCSRHDGIEFSNETPECCAAHLTGEWRRGQAGGSTGEFTVEMHYWENGAAENEPVIVLQGTVEPMFKTAPVTHDMLEPAAVSPSDSMSSADAAVSGAVTMEDLVHEEAPAVLSETEAADVCHAQWAGFIDRLIAQPVTNSVQTEQPNSEVDAMDTRSESVDHSLGSDTTAPCKPQTAPAAARMLQCLLPHTQVLTRSAHSIDVAELQIDDELLAGCGQAVVDVVRHFAIQLRDIVQIEFESVANAAAPEQLVVTASHFFPVFRPTCRNTEPVLASEVRIGDLLRSQASLVKVTSVTKSTIRTSAIEVELRDSASSMYISTHSTPIEAYGATMPKLKNGQVKILVFNRFDGFVESLLKSEELEACRGALQQAGFNADLSVYDLGPGKMLVRANLAETVLEALSLRSEPLGRNFVVVSSEFEPIVKLAVRHGAKRTIYVKDEEIMDLPRKSDLTRGKRTFLDASSSSCAGSGVVCSTTDMDEHKGKNPRCLRHN